MRNPRNKAKPIVARFIERRAASYGLSVGKYLRTLVGYDRQNPDVLRKAVQRGA